MPTLIGLAGKQMVVSHHLPFQIELGEQGSQIIKQRVEHRNTEKHKDIGDAQP